VKIVNILCGETIGPAAINSWGKNRARKSHATFPVKTEFTTIRDVKSSTAAW